MAGLDPAIKAEAIGGQTESASATAHRVERRRLDGRVKPGHDGSGEADQFRLAFVHCRRRIAAPSFERIPRFLLFIKTLSQAPLRLGGPSRLGRCAPVPVVALHAGAKPLWIADCASVQDTREFQTAPAADRNVFSISDATRQYRFASPAH
jgi:hypothetical protein